METIRTALKALSLNKIRSFLTMLGVIIGVFSVTSLVALTTGVQNYITDQFNSLGTNLVYITPGKFQINNDPSLMFSANKLEDKHVSNLTRELGDKFEVITAYYELGKKVSYKNNTKTAMIMGGNEGIKDIYSLSLAQGTMFNKSQVEREARVVILGPEMVKKLFSNENPLGKKVKIGDLSYEVIGVTKPKNANFDSIIVAPNTTLKKDFSIEHLSSILLKSKPQYNLDEIKRAVKAIMLTDLKDKEFSVLTQENLLSTIQNILGILSTVLTAIAGISLLVGGIGIMNIMLVSVTERTKEIGLRKALGASSQKIGLQFLVEAIFISLTGGIIGLLLGELASLAAQSFVRAQVPLWTIFLGLGFSILVGIIFGTYPAINAAKKDPIEALRYE